MVKNSKLANGMYGILLLEIVLGIVLIGISPHPTQKQLLSRSRDCEDRAREASRA
jgi:hypothetical protein